jgi:hypothetical protein
VTERNPPGPSVVHIARLETEDDEWISVHHTAEDAEAKLYAVAGAWGVAGFNGPGEILTWSVTSLPVMDSQESADYPETSTLVSLPHDPDDVLLSTFKMSVMRDAAGGLSAEEIAGDLDVTIDEAERRLAELSSHSGLVVELSPGRYRVPASSRWSER